MMEMRYKHTEESSQPSKKGAGRWRDTYVEARVGKGAAESGLEKALLRIKARRNSIEEILKKRERRHLRLKRLPRHKPR